MTFDDRTEKNIATLLPPVQEKARQFMELAIAAMEKHGVTVKIISGTRTYAEQDELYSHGRTKPGPKVTNARGGYSWHNHACAFDIGLFEGKKYLEDSPHYATLGPIGEQVGLEWGGRWKFVDLPHYQYNPNGVTLAEARELHDQGKTVLG